MLRPSEPKNSALAAISSAVLGFGSLLWVLLAGGAFFGNTVAETAGGWLASDGTAAAPAAPAFYIWWPLYLGLAGYFLWQLLPSNRGAQLHQQIRGWAVGSILLNALWLQMIQWDQLGLSLVVMLLLVAVLTTLVRLISTQVLYRATDRWVTRATFGIYYGWILMAAIANAAAWFSSLESQSLDQALKPLTALLILLAGLAICALTFKNPMGIYVNAGSLWAIVWIAVARFSGALPSASVAVCAAVAATLMLICLATSLRHRVGSLLQEMLRRVKGAAGS